MKYIQLLLLASMGLSLCGMDSDEMNRKEDDELKQLRCNAWVQRIRQDSSGEGNLLLTTEIQYGKAINFVFNKEDLLLLYKYQLIKKWSGFGQMYPSSEMPDKYVQETKRSLDKTIESYVKGDVEHFAFISLENESNIKKSSEDEKEKKKREELEGSIIKNPLKTIYLDNKQTGSSPCLKKIIFPTNFALGAGIAQEACIKVGGISSKQIEEIVIKTPAQEVPFGVLGSVEKVGDKPEGILRLKLIERLNIHT